MVKKSDVKSKIAEKPINPNKILMENFVSLQKVLTNLAIKFDNLAGQISKLLELFEISAKALAEKEFQFDRGDRSTKKIVEKIDTLLEQNKTIARGLALMHEKANETNQLPPVQRFPRAPYPPQQFSKPKTNEQTTNFQEYQKSISSPKK